MSELHRQVLLRILVLPIAIGALLFVPAGTIHYWEAWMYMFTLLVPMILAAVYLFAHDPSLLRRRMRMREQERSQKRIVWFASLSFLVLYLITGFDKRFEWSEPSVLVILASDFIVLCGYLLFVQVLKHNTYASRVIEVEEGQELITSGPYRIIRHPMYCAVLIMVYGTPLALGSYWGVFGSILITLSLIARIRNEEKLLMERLVGYDEFTREIKYRLIPKVW